MKKTMQGRRSFLRHAAGTGIGLACAVGKFAGSSGNFSVAQANERPGEEVSPTEDLMREHGILRRVLLLYGEALRRLDAKQNAPAEVITSAAGIIRSFIEDYHERDEEQYIFPRFEKARKMTDLVTTLREQHQAGRKLTAAILQARGKNVADPMRSFIRMYEPHAAREDTVLFPAFRELVSAKELDRT